MLMYSHLVLEPDHGKSRITLTIQVAVGYSWPSCACACTWIYKGSKQFAGRSCKLKRTNTYCLQIVNNGHFGIKHCRTDCRTGLDIFDMVLVVAASWSILHGVISFINKYFQLAWSQGIFNLLASNKQEPSRLNTQEFNVSPHDAATVVDTKRCKVNQNAAASKSCKISSNNTQQSFYKFQRHLVIFYWQRISNQY